MGAVKKLDATTPKKVPSRLVDIDNRNRSPVFPAAPRPHFLKADRLHRLPLIVLDGSGHELARFSSPASLAQYLWADRMGGGRRFNGSASHPRSSERSAVRTAA